MVTVAEAVLLGSACDVAVTEIVAGVGTAGGAVYSPLASTVPHAAPTQPVPDTLQLTAVLVGPVTVAVNCLVSPAKTRALVGEILITTGPTTVTVALPDLEESACETAVTVIVGGLGSLLGAVYSPPLVMVPQADPVQPAPETLQVTAVLMIPVTVAVNCCCAPSFS